MSENAFVYREPVQKSDNWYNMRKFRRFNHITYKKVLNMLQTINLTSPIWSGQ